MSHFFIQCRSNSKLFLRDSEQEALLPIIAYSDTRFECDSSDMPVGDEFEFEIQHPEIKESITGKVSLAGMKADSVFFDVSFFKGKGEVYWLTYFGGRVESLTVADIMSRNCLTCEDNFPVSSAIHEMQKSNTGSIVIVDSELSPTGIFTERDVLNKSLEHGFYSDPIKKHMTSEISVIDDTTSLEEVYTKFQNVRFRHLPIVSDGKLSGIISLRDLVRFWTKLLEIQKNTINKKHESAISMIVHDLRSPIFAIRSINEIILQDKSEMQTYIDQDFPTLVDESCGSMISLIDDLLEVSAAKTSMTSIKTSPNKLHELLDKALATFVPQAKFKGIEITTNIEEVPTTLLDKRRFTQVIQNVVSNAIKYSEKNSTIEVELKLIDGQIELSVSDHGQGIKEEELHRVFDELCKISSMPTDNEPSTGLGLSIAKKMIEAHGGTISVESEPWKKTTFFIRLPVQEKQKIAA